MAAPPRPRALLFDLNGTLFPADSAADAFRQLGLPGSAVEVREPCPPRCPPPALVCSCPPAASTRARLAHPPHRPTILKTQTWFAAVLRDGFAAQLAGTFLPFTHFAALQLGAMLAAHPRSPRSPRGPHGAQ